MANPGRSIPKLVASVDLLSLPIGSVEGYILSRIDGQVTLDELVDLVALPRAQVEAALERLAALGAIVIEEPPSAASGGSTISSRMPRPPSGVRAPTRASSPGEVRPAASYDSALLDEEVDLDPERRKRVLELFTALGRLNHYELLGIPDHADKNEIRTAYFALSKLVHPDTMYGKQLGSYKPKMEAIFKRATEAYETLSKRKRREEYDASLGLESLEARLAKAPPRPSPPPAGPPSGASAVRPRPPSSQTAVRPSERGLRVPEPVAHVATPPAPPAPASPPARPSSHPSTDAARREAQQRVIEQIARMTGRSVPPPSSSRPPPSGPISAHGSRITAPSSDRAPTSGRDSLLRDLASSLREANRLTGSERVDKHLRAARAAEHAGDLVGAARSLRLAMDLCPERPEIAAEYRRVRGILARAQADSYEKQALREERMEMWGAAAISWSRVAEGRPDSAIPHRRAAHCLWRSNGDLKRARDLAQRAVELDPRDIEARIVLGRVYLAAGMKLNARRELEAAAKLDPKDEIVKSLLRESKS